jgi:hypothetical protein
VALKELAEHRRKEVRALAIRSATYLGEFEPAVDALLEKDEKNLWSTYIEELRAAVARSPEAATRVRTALDKQRGADGASLFRMLWGYSAQNLESGSAAELVDGLTDDSLDHRVLAFWNLQTITGLPNYGYNPADLAKNRTAAVNRWKERLRQGKIVPRSTAAGKAKAASSKAADNP